MSGHTSRICWLIPFTEREFFKRCLFIKDKLNHQFYIEVLRGLREDVWRKCPDIRHTQDWLLHHKNAPAHMAFVYSTAFNWEQYGGGPPPSSLRIICVRIDENLVKDTKIQEYHWYWSWITDSAGKNHETGILEILPARKVLAPPTLGTIPTCNQGKNNTVILLQSRSFGLHVVCEIFVCHKVPYGAAFLSFSSVLGENLVCIFIGDLFSRTLPPLYNVLLCEWVISWW